MSRGELHRRGDITGRKFFRVCMAWYARHVVTKNMRVVVLGRRELAFLAWMDPHHGARRFGDSGERASGVGLWSHKVLVGKND